MKNKNPFDELIEAWCDNKCAFRMSVRHLNFILDYLNCPVHLDSWWMNLQGKELDMFYYMRLLFDREMWEDGQR